MSIEELNSNHLGRWKAYVAAHPNATFYHQAGWKSVIERTFGHRTYYLMVLRNGTLRGVLPMVHLKSVLFGSILCSMPFLNFGGILADDAEAQSDLVEAARSVMKATRSDYLELRHLQPTGMGLPTKTHKVSMTLELDADPEKIWNGFKSKHRQNIRKALKSDLKIRSGTIELLEDFFKILSIGWRNLGTPIYAMSFFEEILREFGASVRIFVVYHEGKPIAAAFNGLFRDTVEGMWTYSLREYSHLQTNYFLYWKMIEKACEGGYKRFHLGRSSTESGAEFFKTKWNAVPHQLYWEYLLSKAGTPLPQLQVDNPKYRLAINVWRRLPVPLTLLIGPPVAKYIP